MPSRECRVFANYILFRWFSLEPQLFYIQKGAVQGSTVIKYDILSLPILANFKFGSEAARLVLFSGISLDLAVNQSSVTTGPNTNLSSPLSYRSVDIGFHAGVGGEFALTDKLYLLGNVRAVSGILDLDTSTTTETRFTTFLFLAGLGYKL